MSSPTKNWARSFQPFLGLLVTNKQTNRQTNKQTDKQTDRQAKFIYRRIKG